jgi:hypothetical protein
MNNAGVYDGLNSGYLPMAEIPVINVSDDSIEIVSYTENADIYYAFNGNPDKDADGIFYEGKFKISEGGSLKAIAYKYDLKYNFDWRPSETASEDVVYSDINFAGREKITINPNPVKNIVQIRCFQTYFLGEIKVLNSRGFKVKSVNVQNVKSVEIDLTDFKPGIYLVSYEGLMQKLIKL